MLQEFTKEELAAKKVNELKEICKELNLETGGLKKAELIEAIYEFQTARDSEVDEELQEEEDSIETVEECATEEIEEETKIDAPNFKILKGVKIIYKDKSCTKFLAKVSGRIEVHEDGTVSKYIPGFREIRGYIK